MISRQDAKIAKKTRERQGRIVREPDALVDRRASAVIGAAIEVHRALGPGLLEAIYEEALCIEMEERGIAFERQAPTILYYKGRVVGEGRLDLLIEGCLLVELKAVSPLPPHAFAQVLSCLRATHLQLGLIINFNALLLKNGVSIEWCFHKTILAILGVLAANRPCQRRVVCLR